MLFIEREKKIGKEGQEKKEGRSEGKKITLIISSTIFFFTDQVK